MSLPLSAARENGPVLPVPLAEGTHFHIIRTARSPRIPNGAGLNSAMCQELGPQPASVDPPGMARRLRRARPQSVASCLSVLVRFSRG